MGIEHHPQTPGNSLPGKSIAGYQAWFKTDADGGWHHWSGKAAPGYNHLSFEVFPDMKEYPDEVLSDTGLPPMPDGSPTRLFRSRTPAVIDTHFRWMKEAGVDGVGVQRFMGDAHAAVEAGDVSHLRMIRNAAEANGRVFYIMYDFSGAFGKPQIPPMLQRDITELLEPQIIPSALYAHADGKPVICLWGLSGVTGSRYPERALILPFIEWLKARGYFVIGGIPDNHWSSDESDYRDVYEALDMISPWTVGRYGPASVEAWQERILPAEQAWCRAHGKHYQPVLFPGFAWSNWHGGLPNATPRDGGGFLWKQGTIYAQAGVEQVYFAMFDEYDEGTAIMKAAEDSFAIPTGAQYFQTLAADEQWLSADYFLRLAGEITRLMRGECALTERPAIPLSTGPVYWRTGFEQRYSLVRHRWRQPPTPVLAPVDIVGARARTLLAEEVLLTRLGAVECADAPTGGYAYRLTGTSQGDGRFVLRLAETDIDAGRPLTLTFKRRGAAAVTAGVLYGDARAETLDIAAAEVAGGDEGWRTCSLTLPPRPDAHVTGVLLLAEALPPGGFEAWFDDMVIEEA